MNKIILASTSPRRRELLEREGINFIIDASSIEEIMDETLPIKERLCQLAKEKAYPIHLKYPHDIVIGADTVVYFDESVIGKARSEEEARKILNKLSSHSHFVYTAVAIYNGNDCYTFCDEAKVCFKDISEMIDDYLYSQEWIGKAGAYGIQGQASIFVDHVDGDRDTIIGLPVQRILDYLNQWK